MAYIYNYSTKQVEWDSINERESACPDILTLYRDNTTQISPNNLGFTVNT